MARYRELTVGSLEDYSPGVIAAANAALRKLVHDCVDRPDNKGLRKLNLSIQLRPVLNGETGNLDEVELSIDFSSSEPKRKSSEYRLAVQVSEGQHRLVWTEFVRKAESELALPAPPTGVAGQESGDAVPFGTLARLAGGADRNGGTSGDGVNNGVEPAENLIPLPRL